MVIRSRDAQPREAPCEKAPVPEAENRVPTARAARSRQPGLPAPTEHESRRPRPPNRSFCQYTIEVMVAADSLPAPLTQLSEEETLFQGSVRQFARERLAPHVRAMDEAG